MAFTSVDAGGQPQDVDIKPTKGLVSFFVDAGVWMVPSAAFCLGGLALSSVSSFWWGPTAMAVFIWSAIYYRLGFLEIKQQCYVRFERFGRFFTVKYRGLRWRNPFFDKIVEHGTFIAKSHVLYQNTLEKDKIDFQDITTFIDAAVWYSNCNPVDVANENWGVLTAQIALNAFRVDNPGMRANELIDSIFRPKIEALTSDEAKVKGTSLGSEAITEARASLAAIGIYPLQHDPLVLRDIVLTEEQQKIRDDALRGEAEAKKQSQTLSATSLAVAEIVRHSKELGAPVSYEKAVEMVQQAQMNDTVRNTGANITLVASTIKDVHTMLTLPVKGAVNG